MSADWWTTTVVYQVYPRSFSDSTGNGIGDLPGITARLSHVADLGAGAIWLSPFYRSPMADFGYDISDHCAVDPLFGTLDDFDTLVSTAHGLGLRVLLDFVPNHTSDQHPWFAASRSSRHDPQRDWYVWRDPAPDGGPPNNWVASWGGGPAWTLDPTTGQYYLHCFLSQQPDLNWANPEVVAAMHEVLRFWLDRGVDGFRADVVHLIGKDPLLGDDDPDLIPLPHVVLNHRPEAHPLLRDLRHLLDAYPHAPAMVGEVFLLDTNAMAEYYGNGDELHLSFNFAPLFSPWDAGLWRRHIERTEQALAPRQAWPTWALSNHDVPRHRSRYGGSEDVARSAAVLLMCLRGTPFMYAGEELGLTDADVPADQQVDPGGRDGCRAPVPWTRAAPHGWPGEKPWLPWPPDPGAASAEAQRQDPASMYHLYRRLIAVRSSHAALLSGDQQLLDTPDGVVGWRRLDPDGNQHVTVLVNFGGEQVDVAVDPDRDGEDAATLLVILSSDGLGERTAFTGMLGANQAVVLAGHR
jgi:alpha-glucosidase